MCISQLIMAAFNNMKLTKYFNLLLSVTKTFFEFQGHLKMLVTRARELALAPLSRRTLAMRWWPQWAATWRGVKWSNVMSSISALYCSSCLTQSMWSPWADMWMGDRPFCRRRRKVERRWREINSCAWIILTVAQESRVLRGMIINPWLTRV